MGVPKLNFNTTNFVENCCVYTEKFVYKAKVEVNIIHRWSYKNAKDRYIDPKFSLKTLSLKRLTWNFLVVLANILFVTEGDIKYFY